MSLQPLVPLKKYQIFSSVGFCGLFSWKRRGQIFRLRFLHTTDSPDIDQSVHRQLYLQVIPGQRVVFRAACPSSLQDMGDQAGVIQGSFPKFSTEDGPASRRRAGFEDSARVKRQVAIASGQPGQKCRRMVRWHLCLSERTRRS